MNYFRCNTSGNFTKIVKILRTFVFLFFILSIVCVSKGFSQEFQDGPVKTKLTDREDKIVAEFWVRGKLLGRLPQGTDLEKFDARIENWTRRLNRVFSEKTKIRSITARVSGGMGIVYNGNRQMLIFDKAISNSLKTTPIALARKWAANIRFALKICPYF